MILQRAFLLFWISGLIAFAIIFALYMPLTLPSVPGGIFDHQTAGTGAEVDRIQAAWKAAGIIPDAAIAMIVDCISASIYGLGTILGGCYFRQNITGAARHLGVAIFLAGITFIMANFGETFAQFMQVMANKGSDDLAGLVAVMWPIKVASLIFTFFGIIAAFFIRRKQQKAG